jgi:hypothetical protein
MKKTFVLGVGAQKSGTSWLYEYLSAQKNSNFGALKEYHIWDALYIKECHSLIAPREDRFRYKLQNINNAYEFYFNSLIDDNTSLTGDITPAYAGLPSFAFEKIRNNLEKVGFDVKVVFLMRDPFERCWSAARMARRDHHADTSELELLSQNYKSEQFSFRTNYKATIQSLETVFDRNQIYYGLYEELFYSESIRKLSDFCNCLFQQDFSEKKFNSIKKLTHEPLKLKSEIRKYYTGIYEFCEDRFPSTRFLWAA